MGIFSLKKTRRKKEKETEISNKLAHFLQIVIISHRNIAAVHLRLRFELMKSTWREI
jgi:hypothetical protein